MSAINDVQRIVDGKVFPERRIILIFAKAILELEAKLEKPKAKLKVKSKAKVKIIPKEEW